MKVTKINGIAVGNNTTTTIIVSGGTSGGGGQTENFQWKYKTGTSPAPSNGDFKMNNSEFSGVTELYVNDVTNNGLDVHTIFNVITGNWNIYIQDASDSSKFGLFTTVVSTWIENAHSWTIPVTNVSAGSGGTLTNNTVCGFLLINQNGGGSGVDTYVTGGTHSNGTSVFRNNQGGTFNVTGYATQFTGGTVTGPTNFTGGLTANTISATTFYGDGSNLTGISGGTGSTSPLVFLSEISGSTGITISNRIATNYGNIGNNAFDVSISTSSSTTLGATGAYSFACGQSTIASGARSHAEGSGTVASGDSAHAEGQSTQANGDYGSHAEGYFTKANNTADHAEGGHTTASGGWSHAEGLYSDATGYVSHAEGDYTTASGSYSHSQNVHTQANGYASHAGGNSSYANGDSSFVHSTNSTINGNYSAIIGGQNIIGGANETVYVPDFVIKKVAAVPTGSSDPIGEEGSITYDASYLYVKTSNGWGRLPLDFAW